MEKLTNNFSRSEFACECGCGFDTVDFMLVTVLQDIRDHFNAPIKISSGNRCKEENKNTKGAAKNSEHMKGKAADIKAIGVSPSAIYSYLNEKYPSKFGIGLYYNRVHIDVRKERARWMV